MSVQRYSIIVVVVLSQLAIIAHKHHIELSDGTYLCYVMVEAKPACEPACFGGRQGSPLGRFAQAVESFA